MRTVRTVVFISLLFVIAFAIAVSVYYFAPGAAIALNQNPGQFERAQFDAIVAEVRKQGFKPGEDLRLRIQKFSNPATLHALKPEEKIGRGQGAGLVWARMQANENLIVVIETRDNGHAGEYGFAYSDAPLPLSDFCSGWKRVDVPGNLWITTEKPQINEHWISVLNNLD